MAKFFCDRKKVPWSGKFWSRAQVKHWLVNYDYTIVWNKTFCYRLPRQKPMVQRRHLFSESLGQLITPAVGAVYLLAAQKRVYQPLTKKVTWRKKATVMPGIETTRRI